MYKKIINVLSPEAYGDCHIAGTVNVPVDQLVHYVKQFPKDTELIVYCAHYNCSASRRAWQLLSDLGYTNVYAYEGGIAQWYQKGYPTQGPCQESYIKEPHEPLLQDSEVRSISAEELLEKIQKNN